MLARAGVGVLCARTFFFLAWSAEVWLDGAGRVDVAVAAAEALPVGLAFPPPVAIATMMSSRTKAHR